MSEIFIFAWHDFGVSGNLFQLAPSFGTIFDFPHIFAGEMEQQAENRAKTKRYSERRFGNSKIAPNDVPFGMIAARLCMEYMGMGIQKAREEDR